LFQATIGSLFWYEPNWSPRLLSNLVKEYSRFVFWLLESTCHAAEDRWLRNARSRYSNNDRERLDQPIRLDQSDGGHTTFFHSHSATSDDNQEHHRGETGMLLSSQRRLRMR
jgi:hypothetical protein